MLIGRDYERQQLLNLCNKDESQFCAVYGRRRVGKTFLIRKFFNDTYSFHYVGSHRQSQRAQLQNFRETLAAYSGNSEIPPIADRHDHHEQAGGRIQPV